MKNFSLSHKAAFLLIANAIRGVTNVFIYIVLSRMLPIEEYGTYRQIWLLVTLFSQLIVIGLPSSLNFFIAGRERDEQKSYLSQAILIIAITSIAQIILIYFGRGMLADLFNNSALGPYLIIALPIFLVYPFSHIFSPSFVSKGHFILAAGINVFYSLIVMSLLIVFANVYGNAVGVIQGLVIALLAYSLVSFILLYFKFRTGRIRLSGESLKTQIRYSLPLGIALSIEMLSKFIDKIVISNFYSTAQFSIYANGAFEIPFVSMISGAAMAILFPEFVVLYKDGEYNKIAQHWKNSMRKTSIFLFPIMIFFLAFSEEIIVLMYSSQYADSSPIFSAYLLLLPIRITIISQVLASFDLNKIVLKSIFWGMVANLGLTILCVKLFGMIGAPIGTVVTIYCVQFFMFNRVRNELRSRFRDLFPIKTIMNIVSVSLLIIVGIQLTGFRHDNEVVDLMSKAGVFIIFIGSYVLFTMKSGSKLSGMFK